MDSIKSAALKAMAHWKAMVEQHGHHHLRTMTAEAEAMPLIERYRSSVYWAAHDASIAKGHSEDDAEFFAREANEAAYKELESVTPAHK